SPASSSGASVGGGGKVAAGQTIDEALATALASPTVSALTSKSVPTSMIVSASAGPGQQQPVPATPATSPTPVTPAAAPPAGTPADTPSQAAGTASLAAGFGSTALSFEI